MTSTSPLASNSTTTKSQQTIPQNTVDIKEIRSLVELMRKNGIAVFKLERQNFKLLLKTTEATQQLTPHPPPLPSHHPTYLTPPPPSTSPHPQSITPQSELPSTQPEQPTSTFKAEIKSPMVGTFYAAPSPEAPPYVTVGSSVNPDTVVCIIEAMKVMNEVKADVSGTIAEICVQNGSPVQFGQVLFRVK
ncbi:MAG: acetyl-CoA carboxylase biotin carboxyl carrier protein [Chthoniobacterales bacterium]|nr:acetyl-CoA carboxylase biotin carboxyl carrier protein [Chthoniobacterales bacterium]